MPKDAPSENDIEKAAEGVTEILDEESETIAEKSESDNVVELDFEKENDRMGEVPPEMIANEPRSEDIDDDMPLAA